MDPFFELRRHAGSGHTGKAKLNIVLSAIEEIIVERRGAAASSATITATEYFAALMAALEGGDLSSMDDVLSLLSIILPLTPAAPLRSKFKHVSSVFMTIGRQLHAEGAAAAAAAADDGSGGRSAMLKHLLECLALVLAQQDAAAATWASPSHLQALDFITAHLDDRRPKVRRAAQQALIGLMRAHHRANPLGSVVLGRVNEISLAALRSGDSQRCLHVLGFLADAAPLLPAEKAAPLLGVVLGLQAQGNALLTAHAFRVLSAVVTAAPLPAAVLGGICDALLSAKPSAAGGGGGEAGAAWAALLADACVALHNSGDRAVALASLPSAVQALVGLCESAAPVVGSAAVVALGAVLGTCLDERLLAAAGAAEMAARGEVVTAVASLLDYRYQRNWHAILPGLGRLFARAGLSGALSPLLGGLVALHDALEAAPDAAPPGTLRLVEVSVGDAVAAMGPQVCEREKVVHATLRQTPAPQSHSLPTYFPSTFPHHQFLPLVHPPFPSSRPFLRPCP